VVEKGYQGKMRFLKSLFYQERHFGIMKTEKNWIWKE